jgi:NADH-quinone oxidoreductase subunit M
LAHVGLIAAGAYTLTVDGLRGAVMQMLAHGLVIVGLFYAADIIYKRLGTANIDEMGGIKAHAGKFSTAFVFLVLASVALPLTFNFIGEFTVLYSLLQVDVWFAVAGGLTIVLGAFYMLRMFQQVMLGEASQKPFADLNMGECLVFGLIIGLILILGIYPQPIMELIDPAVKEIVKHIV